MSSRKALALLVILVVGAVVVYVLTPRKSSGLLIDTATTTQNCGDTRFMLAVVHSDHTVSLNRSSGLELPALRPKLAEIFGRRAESVLYVKADPDVPFQEFVEVVDLALREVDLVSLITPQTAGQVKPGSCIVPGCGACARPEPWFTGGRVGD